MAVLPLVVDSSVEGASVIKTISAAQASITDASVAHALNSTFSDTEVEAALNALGAKINLILDALDLGGITA
jgi:hypothetical protein